MPIYEYQCTACHHKFDVLQKISEDPLKKCPKCSKNKVIRLISAAGFQLKGSGWYVTDFKDKKTQKLENKSESTTTESKTSAKSGAESTVSPASTTKTGDSD